MDTQPADRITDLIEQTDGGADVLGEALTALAVEIRDADDLGQRELFLVFNRVRDAWDDEDHRARDALETVLDRISGWCPPSRRLFP